MYETNIDFEALREKVTTELVKTVLSPYAQPVKETNAYLIYPTICHNISGGSNKLYYYKQSHLFHCYTECNSSFDILHY